MSTPAPEKDEWDAGREAARAYSLTDKVRAVIFSSDVAVLRKAERGPSRRQHDKLLTQMQELIRSGKEQEARDAIDNTSWRGPQTIWWTSSIPELTEIIALHDDIIRERMIAAGVSIEEFIADPGVVFFHIWWDRKRRSLMQVVIKRMAKRPNKALQLTRQPNGRLSVFSRDRLYCV